MANSEEGQSGIIIAIDVLIIIFTIFIIIVYSMYKVFKTLPGYFNIFFCVIVTLDNALRLLPGHDESNNDDDQTNTCKAQAICLSVLDKLLVSLITIYSIIFFLLIYNNQLLEKNWKNLFMISLSVGFIISLTLSIIYYKIEIISYKSYVCYVNTKNPFKIISDTIYTAILFAINLFCLIYVLHKICHLIKYYKQENQKIMENAYEKHLIRVILQIIINIMFFVYLILLINKSLGSGPHKDIIYIILCLIVELFFTINETLKQIITCSYKERENPQTNESSSIDEEPYSNL